MHCIGVRRSLVEQHPWLPVSLFKAFIRAKDLCMHELGQIGHLSTSLPWSVAEYERLRKVMGPDFWSYGLEENRRQLETLAGYSHDQGLSIRRLPAEEMFAASTQELFKI
jgi:4,5-dihydroxyphthalate decarboxylase